MPDGSWRTGELPVVHDQSLLFFKQRLVFEDAGAFVVDGPRRMPVEVEGPAYAVVRLTLDAARGEARVVLDDGSEEVVVDDALGMNEQTGRFECAVRSGRARALFTRGAHQTLLEHAEQDQGRFFLRAGGRRIPIRT
jgi:hypothetical protein